MTVAELIEKLRALPPDIPVRYIDQSYMAGHDDVREVKLAPERRWDKDTKQFVLGQYAAIE